MDFVCRDRIMTEGSCITSSQSHTGILNDKPLLGGWFITVIPQRSIIVPLIISYYPISLLCYPSMIPQYPTFVPSRLYPSVVYNLYRYFRLYPSFSLVSYLVIPSRLRCLESLNHPPGDAGCLGSKIIAPQWFCRELEAMAHWRC